MNQFLDLRSHVKSLITYPGVERKRKKAIFSAKKSFYQA